MIASISPLSKLCASPVARSVRCTTQAGADEFVFNVHSSGCRTDSVSGICGASMKISTQYGRVFLGGCTEVVCKSLLVFYDAR